MRFMRLGLAAVFVASCLLAAAVQGGNPQAPAHDHPDVINVGDQMPDTLGTEHQQPSLFLVTSLGAMIAVPQVPSIGRLVHYVMPNGKHRPAMIVEAWDNSSHLNLQVFTDGSNDGPDTPSMLWQTSVEYAESPAPNTWHWPERVAFTQRLAPEAKPETAAA